MIDGIPPKFNAGDVLKAESLQRLSNIVGGLTNSQRGNGSRSISVAGMRFSAIDNESAYDRPFFNNSGGGLTIPAGGVMVIKSYAYGVPTCGRSTVFGAQYNHLINGPYDVEDQKMGGAASVYPAMAAYDSADGTPAFGEYWGPRSGSFLLKKNTPGFRVVCGEGNDEYSNGLDTSNHLVLVRPEPFVRFRGTTTIAHNVDTKHDVNIWYGSALGGYVDTGVDMVNVLNDFASLSSGAICDCVWDGDVSGLSWRMIAGRCG